MGLRDRLAFWKWPGRGMVRWYDPRQLARTGLEIAVTKLLGSRSDARLVEAAGARQDVIDRAGAEEITIDYVADTGDGWAPTYAVAELLARDDLVFGETRLPRGDILIMGGDEVYPLGNRDAYQERLVAPYAAALPKDSVKGTKPLLLAIPGNHDWYQGIGPFLRLFGQNRTIGDWQTLQKRSYFAVKLPYDWWLLAVDSQLDSDIDNEQVAYFERIRAEDMKDGDQIILCTAEPDWVFGGVYDASLHNNIAFLEDNVLGEGVRIRLRLAGDLHHYRRHEEKGDREVQYITAGGGGAFLHPTIGQTDVREFDLKGPRPDDGKAPAVKHTLQLQEPPYPTRAQSRCWTFLNLFFVVKNPLFGFITGLLYLLLAWTFGPLQSPTWKEALAILPQRPGSLFAMGLTIFAFRLFTASRSRLVRWLGGVFHGLLHIGLAFMIARWSTCVADSYGAATGSTSWSLIRMGVVVPCGYFFGATAFGAYLVFMLLVVGRHANEAFSSLRIQGYKNFLRIRITKEDVTVYPIKLDRVPPRHRWRRNDKGGGRSLYSLRAGKLEPELIEKPIVLAHKPAGKSNGDVPDTAGPGPAT